MKNFLAGIGLFFAVCAFLGHFVPGWHFHVVFANDKRTMEWHKDMYERIDKRLADKANEAN